MCNKNNGWVEDVGGIATRITSQPFLVCNGDGLANRRDQTRASVDCDICGKEGEVKLHTRNKGMKDSGSKTE